jgi:hypothetical protein
VISISEKPKAEGCSAIREKAKVREGIKGRSKGFY